LAITNPHYPRASFSTPQPAPSNGDGEHTLRRKRHCTDIYVYSSGGNKVGFCPPASLFRTISAFTARTRHSREHRTSRRRHRLYPKQDTIRQAGSLRALNDSSQTSRRLEGVGNLGNRNGSRLVHHGTTSFIGGSAPLWSRGISTAGGKASEASCIRGRTPHGVARLFGSLRTPATCR
jgi:hypothetical protein